jgi:hypothetical protein
MAAKLFLVEAALAFATAAGEARPQAVLTIASLGSTAPARIQRKAYAALGDRGLQRVIARPIRAGYTGIVHHG